MSRAVSLGLLLALAACDSNQYASGEPKGSLDGGRDGSVDAARDGGDAGTTPPRRDASTQVYDRVCDSIAIEHEPRRPNMLIVLDRSGSMYDEDHGPLVDRWTPAVAAVRDVTTALEDRIQFGLMLFGSDSVCAPGDMQVSPRLHAADEIISELAGHPADVTGGGTPTAASLSLARESLESLENDTYVLLVTDGAPNCNESMNGYRCRCTSPPCEYNNLNCLDDANAVLAVRGLAVSGIRTYVVGYGTTEWADVLDRMAVAGETGSDRHFPVDDGATLETALRQITGSIVSCSTDLAMPPQDLRYVRVSLDGATVAHESVRNDGNGWRLTGDRTVELIGAACERLQDGEAHSLNVTLECDPIPY